MPIDPATLRSYESAESEPERGGRWIWLVLLAAAAIFAGLTAWAFGDAARTVVVGRVVTLAVGVWIAWQLWSGWNEDGLLGVFYRFKHPLGTVLGNDDHGRGKELGVFILLCGSIVAVGVLMARSPVPITWRHILFKAPQTPSP